MPLDFKKTEKEFYLPKAVPAIIDVPQMLFIAIDGKGDPNSSGEYAAAVETLYALAYSIKMGNKAVLEYVVPPLEGFWGGTGGAKIDKSKFEWTMLIRQPDFVTNDFFEAAKIALARKKPAMDTAKARLEKITEGLCVQAMHTGSYDDEGATIALMEGHASEKGFSVDFSPIRRHHEIYLSDPRKTVAAKLKTVLRHPIKKA
ncbi:MAG: GyrI-like domain-containing protein [Spirochaetes bacterium]|nr:GyrI-like domain-containing protein [Spirochaetota bacterium]